MKLRIIIFGLFVGLGGLGFASLFLFVVSETRPLVVASMRVTMTEFAKALSQQVERESGPFSDADSISEVAREAVTRFAKENEAIAFHFVSKADIGDRLKRLKGILLSGRKEEALEYSDGREWVAVEGDALTVLYPIYGEEGVVGYIGLTRPLSFAREIIWNFRWKFAGIGALIGGLTIVAAWWLSSRLTHSLERLANHVRSIRDGRDQTRQRSKSVEIEQLAKSFESMRNALDGKSYVEQYTQSLAHALKAPLAGVRASSELLKENPEGAERQRFLDHILDESQRMNAIVEKLLRLASIESGNAVLEFERIDLVALVSARVDGFRWAKETRGIAITIESDPVEIRGDSFLLGEAISEMLSNAVEFSPNESRIQVLVSKTAEGGRVAILDEGPGIPDWAQRRIGERFYSLPRPHSGKKGTGLGLAFAREVAQRHGGRFSLENREGEQGARAVIEIGSGVVS